MQWYDVNDTVNPSSESKQRIQALIRGWRGNKSLFIKRWDGKYLKNKKLFKQVKTAADFWMVCEVKPNGG